MSLKTKLKVFLSGCADFKYLVSGKYPTFVYRNAIASNEHPVFCFHSVKAGSFEKILRFLKLNKYHTLTTNEFYKLLTNNKRAPATKKILITFDDGERSLWTVAYPLLKKYGFKATAFIVPGIIKDAETCSFNLEDVWEKRTTFKKLFDREQYYNRFCSWKEIQSMYESRVIDFQSHTLSHELIFKSPSVVDFISPFNISRFHSFEFQIYSSDESITYTYNTKKLGAPIYLSAPRMSGSLRYIEDPKIIKMCVEFVNNNGNEKFFKSKHWKRQLLKIIKEYKNIRHMKDRSETEREQKNLIYQDLERSKEIIEEYLPRNKVQHLAYPWGVGSELSIELSKKAGYLSNFWGMGGNDLKNRSGKDPFKISRIGEDFIYCLPGKGRVSIINVIFTKIRRKLSTESPYLGH